MAKIGLQNFLVGALTEAPDGTPTYGVAQKPAKAISCSVSITNADAKLFADDGLAESDTSFQSGTASLGIDDEDTAMMAMLLGHEIANGEMVRNSADIAPYVGFGRIVTKLVGGVRKYKVEFLNKVKFAEPSQEDTTKGESVEFGTSTLEGQVSTLANGQWSVTKTFNTMADAKSYLEGMFASPVSATVTYNVNGGTGTVSSVSTYVGAYIELNDGASITPPSDKHFIGWDTTSTSTTGDLTGLYKVTGSVTLYAIYASD